MILVGVYVGAELAANVTEAKPILLLGWAVDGGTPIYALTFTLIDLLHERLGLAGARRVVAAAFVANVLLALYVRFTIALPAPEFFSHQESYERILGATPRIVGASLTAFLLSTLLDTEVYARCRARLGRGRVVSVLLSNALGTLVDSALFVTLAFYGTFPLIPLILGNYAVKMAVTVASLPLVYARSRPW
jgi:hypothetical protein